ncbi:MAG: cytochrome c [Proteobacteria bacterium]|nr:cytochrome c [Pseudomonadota bacterium]
MRASSVFVAVALACAAVAPASAADIAAGKAKVQQICAACHGLEGNSTTPDYPRLAGQHPDYLAKALRDYQSGKRKNAIMAPMAAGLTAADIDNVAAYYAAQPPVLVDKY